MISLVMIARDEERAIGRALASAAPFVEETVVLDTGSRDATREIAARHGARVEAFEWCDDFAAARNAALDLARHPWRLVLDADEWVSRGGDGLRAWCAAHDDGVLGAIEVRSDFDVRAESSALRDAFELGVSVDRIARVLPEGMGFGGRIHEQPQGGAAILPTGLVVRHDGYTDARKAEKAGRNERLLRLEIQRRDSPYLHYQLAKDLEFHGRQPEALQAYRQALASTPPTAGWRHALVVRTLDALIAARAHREALELFEAERSTWRDSPDLFFSAGNLFLDVALARPLESRHLLAVAADCWRHCLAIGERPELGGSVIGRGSHLAQHNLDVVLGRLGAPPGESSASRGKGR